MSSAQGVVSVWLAPPVPVLFHVVGSLSPFSPGARVPGSLPSPSRTLCHRPLSRRGAGPCGAPRPRCWGVGWALPAGARRAAGCWTKNTKPAQHVTFVGLCLSQSLSVSLPRENSLVNDRLLPTSCRPGGYAGAPSKGLSAPNPPTHVELEGLNSPQPPTSAGPFEFLLWTGVLPTSYRPSCGVLRSPRPPTFASAAHEGSVELEVLGWPRTPTSVEPAVLR